MYSIIIYKSLNSGIKTSGESEESVVPSSSLGFVSLYLLIMIFIAFKIVKSI